MSGLAPRVYLLDIEGTVAPISLVSEVLFPYARMRLADFLERSIVDEAVRADLLLLAQESRAETDADAPRIPESASIEYVVTPDFQVRAFVYLNWLMERDRKSTALKSLQGKIWKAGFESGELKGTLFADVPEALAGWAEKAKVVIYSSGSVEAQRLVFRYSTFGDMTPRIAGYFDTRTGPKRASGSYAAIAAALQVTPGEVAFFSDVVEELDAAREAGAQTRLVVRAGNPAVEEAHGHLVISSFADLDGELR
jgi:2,3-diketo-5-methylthio-1-phosphopentane phosphatase